MSVARRMDVLEARLATRADDDEARTRAAVDAALGRMTVPQILAALRALDAGAEGRQADDEDRAALDLCVRRLRDEGAEVIR